MVADCSIIAVVLMSEVFEIENQMETVVLVKERLTDAIDVQKTMECMTIEILVRDF
jgi:putative cell wall-binding protein